MVNLKHRSAELEVMDDFDLPSAEIDPVLRGLGQVNNLTGNHKSIINELKKFEVTSGASIADWGCGGGDMLIAINQWAQKHNINLKLEGVDAAPAAVKFARQNCAAYHNIGFRQSNVLTDDLGENTADFVISSLFTHHFADDDWIALIKKMYSAAGRCVIVTDLHRHWLLYYAVRLITILTFNKMVKADGPLSVKRAFKRQELESLLALAQIKNYSLEWLWPFRWQIIIYKS